MKKIDHLIPGNNLLTFVIFSAFLLTFGLPQKLIAKETNPLSYTDFALLTGYGMSHPGWGETEIHVETVDLLFRYKRTLFQEMGTSWYRGYHSLLIEPVIHFLIQPSESPMFSLNFLGCYTFTAAKDVQPYIFGGGGPVYIGADITGIGSRWNGNYQFGAGLEWKTNSHHSFLIEVRYHHVSNANTSDPNIPLNSTKFLAGVTF